MDGFINGGTDKGKSGGRAGGGDEVIEVLECLQ